MEWKDIIKSFGVEILKEFGMDAFADAYQQLAVKFAKSYLDDSGTSPALLGRFRLRFMRILRITTYLLDEIDGYLHDKYYDRWKQVKEIMDEDQPIRLRGKKGKKALDEDTKKMKRKLEEEDDD